MNIEKAHPMSRVLGGRIGTAIADRDTIDAILGEPTYTYSADDADGKVTIGWVYATPRGPAEIRDYWWNQEGEWSIAAQNRKAAMWLCRMLRRSGIDASTLYYNARTVIDNRLFKQAA